MNEKGDGYDLDKLAEKLNTPAEPAAPEGLPEDWSGYQLEAAEGETWSDGTPLNFDPKNEVLEPFLKWAHDNKLSQEAVSGAKKILADFLEGGLAAGLEREKGEMTEAFDREMRLLAPEGTPEDKRLEAGMAEAERIADAVAAIDPKNGDAFVRSLNSAANMKTMQELLARAGGPTAGDEPAGAQPADETPFYKRPGYYKTV